MIKLFKSATSGHFWFTINGRNGKVLATSETYTRKENAVNAIGVLTGVVILASGWKAEVVDPIQITDLTA